MIEQFVKANCLSCLLDENCQVEKIPEPFRMQSKVSFRVTYQEYTRYILSMNSKSGVILMADFEYLKELAASQSPKLYAYFLRDMAFAIMKELWFAERYRKGASVIVPASFSSETSGVSQLLLFYQVCGVAESSLRKRVAEMGFDFKPPATAHNLSLYQLAVTLYHTANASVTLREIDLVYDLLN